MSTSDPTQAMPPPQPPSDGGGHGGGGDDDDRDRRNRWMIIGGVLVIGLLAGALIAALAGGGSDNKVATNDISATSTTESSTTTTSTTLPPTTLPPTTVTTHQNVTTTTNASNQPKINSFSSSPNFVACGPSDGTKMVTFSWTTQNASGGVDFIVGDHNAGAYGHYNANGSVQINYTCPPAGMQDSHQYTVKAFGNGGSFVYKTITLSSTTPPT